MTLAIKALAFWMTAAVLLSGSARGDALTIVADEWPPFSGEALHNQGMSLDVISTVLRKTGYDVKTSVLPWARIMDGARSGEYDIIGSLFFDPALQQHIAYSDPFYETEVRFVRRIGDTHTFTSVPDLAGLSIAVGDGFLYEPEFDRAAYLEKDVVTTTLQALQMVAFDRVDLTLDSADVVAHAIGVQDPKLRDRVELAPGTLATQGLFMGVRNDLPNRAQVIEDFNKTLAQMRADGSLDILLAPHVLR